MKTIAHTFGWLFIVAGAVGLLLPFVQGIALIAFGIGLLSFMSPHMQRKIIYFRKILEHYCPSVGRFLAVLEQKCDTVLERITRWRKKK